MINSFIFRKPSSEDGFFVSELIQACPPLDTNSTYCNLLQCEHFSSTSVVVEADGKLVGFMSGYIIPERKNTLFIWQVAVGDEVRGQGMAGKMVEHILNRRELNDIFFIETTITSENKASWSVFEKIAKHYSATLSKEVFFDKEKHFMGNHESEVLVKIGPIKK
ncbi:MAG: diaminobutyrate acetyltransferase [Cellvibrionaceae bacterium]